MPKSKFAVSNEELVRRFREGDRQALSILATQNEGLVWSVAKRYAHKCTSMDVEDLVSEGFIGMLRAVETYDVGAAKFSTYAMQWIRAKIGRAAAADSTRMSVAQRPRVVHLLEKFIREVDELVRRGMAYAEARLSVKKEMKLSSQLLEDLESFGHAKYLTSLDAPVFEGTDMTLHDVTPETGGLSSDVEDVVDGEFLRQRIDRLRPRLDEREIAVLDGRLLGDDKTLGDIGREFNLCRERVRQIEDQLKKKLRSVLSVRKGGKVVLREMRSPMESTIESAALIPFAPKRRGRRPKVKPLVAVAKPLPSPLTLEEAVAKQEKARVQALRMRQALRLVRETQSEKVLPLLPEASSQRRTPEKVSVKVTPEDVASRYNYATGHCFACGKNVPPWERKQHAIDHDRATLGLLSGD